MIWSKFYDIGVLEKKVDELTTTNLAKLPYFPSFLSLFSVIVNCFDGDSDRIKLVSELAKVQ
ncbi:MAG TPA: hypothetical protein DGG95_15670 [Cytophagales bacterium]|nr:hypothetical protein [Cytophagales bacterium]